MKQYRVTIWVTQDIEANTPEEAEDQAYDLFVCGDIRNRDFVVEAEEKEEEIF